MPHSSSAQGEEIDLHVGISLGVLNTRNGTFTLKTIPCPINRPVNSRIADIDLIALDYYFS